jgi:C4-type Zn-finger protein
MTQTDKVICPVCGAEMNHHATKLDYEFDDQAAVDPVFGGVLNEAYTCPRCGHIELKTASLGSFSETHTP